MEPAMKKTILLPLLILLSGLLSAATCPADELTIDEVVRQVLAHNERVEAKSELLASARAEAQASRGERLFRLDAESRIDYLKEEPFERFNGTPILVNDDRTAHHQLTLTQPLFTGFALSTRQQLAELGVDSARLELEQVRADLTLEARLAALDLLRRRALLELARAQHEQFLRHRDDALAMERQGLIARADLLKAEVALAAAEQQKTRAEADVSLAKSRLNQLMGRPEATPVQLTTPASPADSDPDLAFLQDEAVRRRPVMRQFDLEITKAEKAVRLARAPFYPQAALVAAYQRDGQDLLAEENDYRNDENAVVGLRLSWNLFHGGADRARAAAATSRLRAVSFLRADVEKQVRLQVEQAWRDLEVAIKNLATARQAVDQARENHRLSELQFKEGLIPIADLLEARSLQTEAETRLLEARYGLLAARARLDRAVGNSPVEADR